MGNIVFSKITTDYPRVDIDSIEVGSVVWHYHHGIMVVYNTDITFYGRKAVKCLDENGYIVNITFYTVADSLEEYHVLRIPDDKIAFEDADVAIKIAKKMMSKPALQKLGHLVKGKFEELRIKIKEYEDKGSYSE